MKYNIQIFEEEYTVEEKVLEQMVNVFSMKLIRKIKTQKGTIKLGMGSLEPYIREKIKNTNKNQ
jgi:hypothetical protein